MKTVDYPEHVDCPGCRHRRKVHLRDQPSEGWIARIETHDIVDVCVSSDDGRQCTIRRTCPASGAVVSRWETRS